MRHSKTRQKNGDENEMNRVLASIQWKRTQRLFCMREFFSNNDKLVSLTGFGEEMFNWDVQLGRKIFKSGNWTN